MVFLDRQNMPIGMDFVNPVTYTYDSTSYTVLKTATYIIHLKATSVT